MYHIYIRDANLNKIGELSDFNKLELIPRFNAVGSFVLDLPTDSFAARELIKPKSGIIVSRDGKNVFSGPVTSRKRTFNGTSDTMTFAGSDELVHLVRNLAYPVTDGPFTNSDYDVKTGPAETIMKRYLTDNIGWRLDRALAIVTETDQGMGNVITGRARFQTLLELMQSLALAGGGLGFRMVQVDKNYEFQVYQPSDKTRSAFFSPILGNLSSFDYSIEAPESNYVIIGGSGEGKDRIILEKNDNISGLKYGGIQTFIDRRDTTDTTELQQAMDEELTSKGEKVSLNFTPIDTPQLTFYKDYNLGDKVSVVLTQPNEVIDVETLYYFISAYQTVPVQSERIRKIQEKLDVLQDIVREVKITIDTNGESIAPTVGNESSYSSSVIGIFDRMKKLDRRISNIERV